MNWYLFWVFVNGMSTYQFKCPRELNRKLRIRIVCSEKSPEQYSCLLDQLSNVYQESCTEPADFVRPGQKYVIGVFRKNIDCNLWRYQPFKFWSHQLSDCVFSKSHCNEIGQMMFNLGSPDDNSVCRCDHSLGYAFINHPKHSCYCEPSREDCTCYKKTCPTDYVLTSDYMCKHPLFVNFSCQDDEPHSITTQTTTLSLDQQDAEYFSNTDIPHKSLIPYFIICIIVSITILFILVIMEKCEFLTTTSFGYLSYESADIKPLSIECQFPDLIMPGSLEYNVSLDETESHSEYDKEFNQDLFKQTPEDIIDNESVSSAMDIKCMEKRKEYKFEGNELYELTRQINMKITSKEKNSVIPAVIEIGLTYSGIAAGIPHSTRSQQTMKILLPSWDSKYSGIDNNKTATAILFRPDKTVDSIGYEAESLHHLKNKDKHEEWFFSKTFMMTLCDQEDTDTEDIYIQDTQNKTKLDAVYVLSAFIKKMKAKILTETRNRWNADIVWIFTVPPIWKIKEKQLMSRAAEMAGISSENLILLEEPEAVFKYYSISQNSKDSICTRQTKKLPESYRCIVLHIGESAINATVMEVKGNISYEMTYTVFSQYGGVSQEVLKLINLFFSENVTKLCKKNHPHEYIELFAYIEEKMKTVLVQPTVNKDVKIRIPPVWLEVFKTTKRIALSDDITNSDLKQFVSFVSDKIKISNDLFMTFYDSFIQNRLQVIEKLLAEESVTGISVLFLAGDFIDNVFISALEQRYPKHTVCVANDPKLVVLEGALMYWDEQLKVHIRNNLQAK